LIGGESLADAISSFVLSVEVPFLHEVISSFLINVANAEVMHESVNFTAVQVGHSDGTIFAHTN
jgi:hypothetical protein